MAQQQEDVGGQIIAPKQFLLNELILLCRQGAGQMLRSPRDILTADQMCQIRKLRGPGEFLQNAPQKKEAADVDGWRQRRVLRAHMGIPAEDVRITAQLT